MINLDVPKFKLALDSILHVLEKLSEIQNFVGLISECKIGTDNKGGYEVKSGNILTLPPSSTSFFCQTRITRRGGGQFDPPL